MRQLILLFSFLLVGCAPEYPASANVSELRELEGGASYSITEPGPSLNYTPDIEYEMPPEILYGPCVCEFTHWTDNGLMCVGIRCTPECSEEVRSCNERRRACAPGPL